jgi:site-specific recombinase XerD
MMIYEAVPHYLKGLENSCSPRTITTYGQALKKFASLVGGEKVPLTHDTFILFIDKIKDLNKSSQGIYRTAVLGLFDCASGLDTSIDYAAVVRYNHKNKRKPGRSITDVELEPINQVLKYCEGIRGDVFVMRDRALILTLADTGLRISEACDLTRGGVNWLNGRAIVTGKGDVTDVVRFSIRSMKALQEYFIERKDGSSGKPLASLPLFSRHDDGAGGKLAALTTSGAWQAIKHRIHDAGIDPKSIRVHDFRHYFVSVIVMLTGDIKMAQTLARHKNITVTQRYAHLDGKADEAYDKIFNRG